MIVDLHLRGKSVIVIGGGGEGLRRINSLLEQGCKIMLLSEQIDGKLDEYVQEKRIQFRRVSLQDADFLSGLDPYMVIAATNNDFLNRKIVDKARSAGCLAYASNDPEASDFAHTTVIDIEGAVQVAISTGGQSPVMAKRIRAKVESALKDTIDKADIAQIKLQKMARREARGRISTQVQRRSFLYEVVNDETVKQLIKDDDPVGARARINMMLGRLDEK